MRKKILHLLIAMVWLINGLFCKLLNLVPRHQLIVARILGTAHAPLFTKLIGTGEVVMAFWIISGFRSRWCALAQALLIATMNLIEYFLAPDLLLFEHMNIIFAVAFIALILANEFLPKTSSSSQSVLY